MTQDPTAKPIVITMGDPSGVGADVTVKAIASLPPAVRARYAVIGGQATLERARAATGASLGLADAAGDGALRVIDVPVPGLPGRSGVMDPARGEASFRYIQRAVELAQAGQAAAIVTAPINKETLNAAGHNSDGHTGMLAHLTQSPASWMLLASERLNVIHVSTHVSLRDAIGRATPERVAETIRMGHRHLRRMGVDQPRIAVAGLNPHCGENGLFGDADDRQIAPGVALARAEGINVLGPISADTVYCRAHRGDFDLVVAQYHDQGHIPIKLIAFDTAVNVSLGLPIDRCSVDHGTTFDIAGTGRANHVNMVSALAYGRRLAAAFGDGGGGVTAICARGTRSRDLIASGSARPAPTTAPACTKRPAWDSQGPPAAAWPARCKAVQVRPRYDASGGCRSS